jgi:small subunit ribosomal protein S1
MSESFAELFEESLKTLNLQAGSIITGVIVDIDYQARWVTVHAGLKSEALIPLEQFYNDAGDLTINVGDEVHVALDSVEDGFGETKLSREKAKRAECWIVLEAAFAAEEASLLSHHPPCLVAHSRTKVYEISPALTLC